MCGLESNHPHPDAHVCPKTFIAHRILEWKILSIDFKPQENLDPSYPCSLASSRFTMVQAGIGDPSFVAAHEVEKATGEYF